MITKFNGILFVAGGLILSIAQSSFLAADTQKNYPKAYNDEYNTSEMPRTHAEGHDAETHGLTGAEGSYGRGGSGVGEKIVGETVGEKERYRGTTVDKSNVDKIISRWEDKPREVALKMIDKYGQPNEASRNHLIWYNNGPWKKTVVINEEVPHNFPREHQDVLIQTVNYQVPPDKIDDLARYNGSITVKRTQGEMSSQCGNEKMNILALNLADDIVKGKRSAEDARRTYAEQAMAIMDGKKVSLADKLQFNPKTRETAYRDEPIAGKTVMKEPGGKSIGTVNKPAVDRIISKWDNKPREIAQKMINKYGLPNEATQNHLIWHNNGPWERTEVVNEEIQHNFPKEHEDVLIQTVNYQVPADKVEELAQYDGSLIVERTKGELSSLCGNEKMNILALNLADDIIKGKLDVDEARNTYAEQAMAAMEGKPAPLTESLQFETQPQGTSDPDQPATKGIIEKAKEAVGLQ